MIITLSLGPGDDHYWVRQEDGTWIGSTDQRPLALDALLEEISGRIGLKLGEQQ